MELELANWRVLVKKSEIKITENDLIKYNAKAIVDTSSKSTWWFSIPAEWNTEAIIIINQMYWKKVVFTIKNKSSWSDLCRASIESINYAIVNRTK